MLLYLLYSFVCLYFYSILKFYCLILIKTKKPNMVQNFTTQIIYMYTHTHMPRDCLGD